MHDPDINEQKKRKKEMLALEVFYEILFGVG